MIWSKFGLKRGFYQLESSLASHSITRFWIKKRKKKRYKRLWGYNFSRRNYNKPSEKFFRAYCRWYFHKFFKRTLLRLDQNVITVNFKKCLLSFQWFFSKEGNKTGRSELEETEETHTLKNAKQLRSFFVFLC